MSSSTDDIDSLFTDDPVLPYREEESPVQEYSNDDIGIPTQEEEDNTPPSWDEEPDPSPQDEESETPSWEDALPAGAFSTDPQEEPSVENPTPPPLAKYPSTILQWFIICASVGIIITSTTLFLATLAPANRIALPIYTLSITLSNLAIFLGVMHLWRKRKNPGATAPGS